MTASSTCCSLSARHSAILPEGTNYTFWGRGVSQGHSDAIRRIEGVADARQYTVPVEEAVTALSDSYSFERRGIRLVRIENSAQLCSAPELADIITKTLETRKPPKLSPSQLETLTVIAYYQPATKAYVEQIRGVDSAYSVSALLTKKLIRECGRLNVPGRPILYETTPDFLRVFGLQSLDELPEIERVDLHEKKEQLVLNMTGEGENAP